MNFYELYVLNTALDGEDIYSVQKFSSKRLTKATVELIKDVLIQKGYLEDYHTLTPLGVMEIRKLKQFKEAQKYVRILNLTIGFMNRGKGILLTQTKNREYCFKGVDLSNSLDILVETFPDLLQDNETIDTYEKVDSYVNPRNLLKEFSVNTKTSFTLSTEIPLGDVQNTKDLFFEAKGKKYYYDCITHLLHERCGYELVDILRKRLEVI